MLHTVKICFAWIMLPRTPFFFPRYSHIMILYLHWFTEWNAAYSGFCESRLVRQMIAHSDLPVYRALCHAFLWVLGSNYIALPWFTFCLSALCWPHPVINAVSMAIAIFWLSKRFTDTKESFHLNVMNQPGRMRTNEECQYVIKMKEKVQCLYSMYHTYHT